MSTSPIGSELLRPVLAPLLGRARTLPAEAYTSQEVSGLFPSLLISLHPDYVMTHRVEPLAPGRTRIECQWLFPQEVWNRPDFSPAYASEFWDVTNREDWLACESVYRGLQSQGFHQGPFAWSEDEVHVFMAMVARAYLDGRPSEPPHVPEAVTAGA